jgi:transcriptional regulator GlxA family with amidase domain
MREQPAANDVSTSQRRRIAVVLFEGFTVLDVFGPVQAFAMAGSRREDGSFHRFFEVVTIAPEAGAVRSSEGPSVVADYGFADAPGFDILLVPGGMGTRRLASDAGFIEALRALTQRSPMVTSVCTGGALLARTGVLDSRRATSNKMAWEWVLQQGDKVDWQRRARWVDTGDVVTSSGVSAGIDMALGLIARLHGRETAEQAARAMEYIWNDEPQNDPFA